MADKLKDFFNEDIVCAIAADLHRAYPPLKTTPFVAACMKGLEDLELTERAWHIAEVMHDHLPSPFAAAARVIIDSLPPPLASTETFGMAPFRYAPHTFFVQKYGLDDFEAAVQAQYELTQRFSAESSIRAYLVKYPEETYARLREWTRDKSPHVRRLVSEGTRPRLPWAPRLRAFQENPRPVIALLELLKDDPERYVQRSVANSINDIGKDHPELAIEVCRAWLVNATPQREWIVRHALRSLIKQGHRGALRLMGVSGKPAVSITNVRLVPSPLKVGDKLRFSFDLASTSRREQDLLVDYAVHFVKSNGGTRSKVFKLRKIALPAGQSVELNGSISFKDMTTRQHYAGRHRIEVLVNGVPHPSPSSRCERAEETIQIAGGVYAAMDAS